MVKTIEYDLKMKLKGKNFLYSGIDVDYNREYSCESSGCDSEGICRCSTIYDQHITYVDVSTLANVIYDMIYDNSKSSERQNKINDIFGITKELEIYTIDRVIRKALIYDKNIWEINVGGGYYGEEIESVELDDKYADKLEKILSEALSINSVKERVEYLLQLEYDYILPELKNKNYRIVTIDKSNITFGNDTHLKKVSKKDLEFYSDSEYTGIRGVVIKKDSKYKLIDGYHRISRTNRETVRVIEAY